VAARFCAALLSLHSLVASSLPKKFTREFSVDRPAHRGFAQESDNAGAILDKK
jgi:hypothetical protein